MLPEKPYAGLTYYENEQQEIFAGRDREAKECADLLFGSDVVILHGRTGCGKSSFLRAGLRPLLERSGIAIAFPQNTSLRVVRSGVRPLRSVASEIWEIAESIIDGKPLYSGGDPDVANDIISGHDRDSFVQKIGTSSSRTIKTLTRLTETFETAPVIVIDQAEEYLTLVDSELSGSENPKRDERKLRLEQSEYFNFISNAARGKLHGVRTIVSLRSEYKGEFDDAVYRSGPRPGDRYASFQLKEMDKKQLVEAIKRPTLNRNELAVLLRREPDESVPDLKAAFDFSYEDGVPERIADWLLDKTRVAQGGLLPAMQVACLRLYETSKRNRSIKRRSHHVIGETEVRRLGKDASNQVGEYLREKVQAALRRSLEETKNKRKDTGNEASLTGEYPQAIEDWYDGLHNALVRIEADGRTTTRSVPATGEGSLYSFLQKSIGSRELSGVSVFDLTPNMMEFLRSDNVLRSELREGAEFLTLGHDSLALALNNWRSSTGRARSMPNKMGMNSPRAFEKYSFKELFGDEELLQVDFCVPTTYMWDHQLPHFASAMGFDKRLGFTFSSYDSVSVTSGTGRTDLTSWSKHRTAIHSIDKATREDFTEQVLVPGDILSFPDDHGKGQWTDVVVTDLFEGNCLIGVTDFGDDLYQHDNRQHQDRTALQLTALKKIMEQLVELGDAEIFITRGDKSAEAFLRLACEFADLSPDKIANKITRLPSRYTPKDMLFEKLLNSTGDDQGENKFMVATAYGRALSEQAGFRTYFSAAHMLSLADIRLAKSESRNAELVRKVQEIFQHTLWQVGIAPSQWTESENRATILRLASIGYYTSEYIRAAPEVFVNYIHEWVNRDVLSVDSDDEADVGSNQLGIDVIKDSVQSSFSFFAFDEYPRLIYHLEATRAYWWDMASTEEINSDVLERRKSSRDLRRSGAKSVAHEIYLELTSLRSKTLEAFDDVSRHLRSLRWSGHLDSNDSSLNSALAEVERAWRNFKIFNFFDSHRQMYSAAITLQFCIEEFQRSASNPKKRSSTSKRKTFQAQKEVIFSLKVSARLRHVRVHNC